MNPTVITSVTASKIDLALTEPFAIATGAPTVAANVLVTLQLEDGTTGYGEAAPFTAVSGETQDSSFQAVESARALLVGQDARRYRPLSLILGEALGVETAARAALEMAMLDALTRHHRLPLWVFFGGDGAAIDTDMTITAGDAEHAARAAAAVRARSIVTIKVKVGVLSPEEDAERLAAVRRVAPTSPLLIDANGGYSPAQAVELLGIAKKRDLRIELFEQPVAPRDWAEFRHLSRSSDVAVCADESARSAAEVLALVRDGAVEAVNIKTMKCGVVEATSIWSIARAAKKKIMIGGMVESSLSMSFSVHLAAGLGGFSYADLDTPMFIVQDPFTGGFAQEGAMLSVLHVEAGHGARPHSGATLHGSKPRAT